MKSVLKFGLVATVLLALAGCHPIQALRSTKACHNPKPYITAQNAAPLKIPPGFDVPDTTNALHIPELKEPAPPARKGKDPCLDEPPPFRVVKPAA